VEVDTAQSDGVATRHRQAGFPATGQQRTEQQDRCPHSGDQLLVDPNWMDMVGTDRYREPEFRPGPVQSRAEAL
jgi:hypothetical protein